MKNIFFFATFLFCFSAFCEQSVFLVEGQAGKQIGMTSDFSHFTYLTEDKSQLSLYPDISSDGDWVTYVQGSDKDSLQIVVYNSKTLKKEIWGEKGFILHPRFSRNGDKLFFSLKMGSGNKIVYYDLSKLRTNNIPIEVAGIKYFALAPTLLDLPDQGYFPSPYQEGDKIIYQKNDSANKRQIVIYSLIDKKEEIIDEGMAPSLSKDERYVAYTKKIENNWDIYVYDLLEKTKIKVTSHFASDFAPTFDRLGDLIYCSDRLESGVFSLFKQEKKSWAQQKEIEKVILTRPGVSFYAPKISGDISFEQKVEAKMIGEPRSSFGSIAYDNKIFVVGGHQGAEHTYPPESFTARTTIYNFAQKKWIDVKERNFKAHGFALAAYNRFIYAFGGFSYEENNKPKWKSLDVVERYDIDKDEWKVVAQMPVRRSSNIVATVGSKVYLIGGWDSTPKFPGDIDGTFLDQIDVYDLETNSFTTLTTKLPKLRRAFSSFVRNGKIYLVGGISEGGTHFNLIRNLTEFDPATNEFKELPPLPFATFAPAAGLLDDRAFIFGGMIKIGTSEEDYQYVRHIYQFDFNSMSWSHTGRYLHESKGFSQVVNLSQGLGILGGHSYQDNSDHPLDTFEIFADHGHL